MFVSQVSAAKSESDNISRICKHLGSESNIRTLILAQVTKVEMLIIIVKISMWHAL